MKEPTWVLITRFPVNWFQGLECLTHSALQLVNALSSLPAQAGNLAPRAQVLFDPPRRRITKSLSIPNTRQAVGAFFVH